MIRRGRPARSATLTSQLRHVLGVPRRPFRRSAASDRGRRVFTRSRDTCQMVIATNAGCRVDDPPETAISKTGAASTSRTRRIRTWRAREVATCARNARAHRAMESAVRGRYPEVAITGSPARTRSPCGGGTRSERSRGACGLRMAPCSPGTALERSSTDGERSPRAPRVPRSGHGRRVPVQRSTRRHSVELASASARCSVPGVPTGAGRAADRPCGRSARSPRSARH